MAGVCERGEVAALDLVFALRAGFDGAQVVGDGEVDGAVIAEFEVQEGEVSQAAPVAAVQRVGAAQVERAGDKFAVVFGEHEDDAVPEAFGEEGEERLREVGAAPFAIDGAFVEAVEGFPVGFVGLGAGEGVEGQAAGVGIPAFPLEGFAFA